MLWAALSVGLQKEKILSWVQRNGDKSEGSWDGCSDIFQSNRIETGDDLKEHEATKNATNSVKPVKRKIWNWGRALEQIHQEGSWQVAWCPTSLLGLISCMHPPIWGKRKEDVFSLKHLRKLFSAVFRKGGTRAFLSETTRNLHVCGQKLKVNLLLCYLRDSGLFRVTWGPFRQGNSGHDQSPFRTKYLQCCLPWCSWCTASLCLVTAVHSTLIMVLAFKI